MQVKNNTAYSRLGDAQSRTDGPAKVCGLATYAAEHRLAQKPLVGWVVEASVASGTIQSIDVTAAKHQDGVVEILTYDNAPQQQPFGAPEGADRFTQSHALLNDKKIRYFGFPVALVVAQTIEQARYAAQMVQVNIAPESVNLLQQPEEATQVPQTLDGGFEPDTSIGNFEHAKRQASLVLDVTYSTPTQISAAMEPHACIADYDGSKLTVYVSIQIVASGVTALANTLKMKEEDIHIVSPYIGGGFGSKLGIHNDAVLACLAALHLRRPVRVALHRRQVFHHTPHRGHSFQRIQLAASEQGKLLGISHQSYMPMARDYQFAEATGACARVTYASEAIISEHRIKAVDSPMIDSTRAPGDAIGSLAFESVIDEMAQSLDIDPLEFRLMNMPENHPVTGKPFSTHKLRDCLEKGAEQFGWKSQHSSSGAIKRRGVGLACAMRMNVIAPCAARLSLCQDGRLRIQTDMTDIGTGTYTILGQVVSAYFHTDISLIDVELGDSQHPTSSGSGGSMGASSSGSAVQAACEMLAEKLKKKMNGADDHEIRITGAHVYLINPATDETISSLTVEELLAGDESLSVEGAIEPGDDHENYEQYSSGAHFAEVEVDMATGEITIIRQLGVFSAGKILNHKTATSQVIGGMIWGASYALREDLHTDKRDGSFINNDLAEYHIPVNRDIGNISVHFIEKPDFKACKLGSKGIGELGITGAGAAIANAVANASGIRVRSFPITADKILEAKANYAG